MTVRVFGAVAAAMALAACSHGPKTPPAASARVVPANEVDAIVALLDRGERDEARKRVRAGLKHDPDSAALRVLSDSIDKEPRELLGPDSFPYTVRSGETMIGLSERFLGNRLKAYQLARYNGIDTPQSLAAGQLLRIPGKPPRIEQPRRSPSPPPVRSAASPPRAKPPTSRAAVPVANPAAAQRLRGVGLAALNAGTPVRAVVALRRAAALDPGNPVIARDLGRAERIAATVRSRR